MVRASLLLVCALFYAAAEARRFFGSCPRVDTVSLDNKEILGKWYLYAIEPNKWFQQCFKYDITADSSSGEYYVKETYTNNYKLFKTKSTNDYNLEVHIDSPKFVLKKKIIKVIPSSEEWLLASTDYKEYMILYRCQPTLPWWQKEEIQVWVKDEKLVSGVTVPAAIINAVKKVGFGWNELQIKKESDCK